MKNNIFVAEVKTQSPFGFRSSYSWDRLFEVANVYGDMISIHTDPRWGGSMDDLKNVRNKTSKAILAKGIHSTDKEIFDALHNGADKVLVVGRMPQLSLLLLNCVWIEPNNLEQLKMIPEGVTAVWNSRDLLTGELKTETWEDARKIHKGTLIQASNIKTLLDIKLDSDGYIIGENLVNFVEDII